MALLAKNFIYDGVPSEAYNLVCYGVGNEGQNEGKLNDGFSVVSDEVSRRIRPIHYGISRGHPLEFSFTFGSLEYMDRTQVEAVSHWLLGRQQFSPLVFEQDDMGDIRYNAIITSVELVQLGGLVVAFKANVVCDSPYAFRKASDITLTLTGGENFIYNNESNVPGFYSPKIFAHINEGTNLTIINKTANETFSLNFGGTNNTTLNIIIDGENQVLAPYKSTLPQGMNLYKHMILDGKEHFVFPRFMRGENEVEILGVGNVTVVSEFPITIGY